jgi:hypothetical protein
MRRIKYIIQPRLAKILEELGEDIKLARLRRKLSTAQVSERAGISLYSLLARKYRYGNFGFCIKS